MELTDDTRIDIKAKIERDAFINGLHQLADFLTAHPTIPASSWGYHSLDVSVFGVDKATLVETATLPHTRWNKNYGATYFELSRTFDGGVKFSLNASRKEVCTAEVVGTETVEVLDPAAPKITVERDVIEWKCHPLLTAEG